jgi:hypothetical protein
MALPVEDVRLRLQALAYVIKLYNELTAENGAPTLGTQNQAVDFILAAPELRRAVADWAATTNIDEASTAPLRTLPLDELCRDVRAFREDYGYGAAGWRGLQRNASAISAEIKASCRRQDRPVSCGPSVWRHVIIRLTSATALAWCKACFLGGVGNPRCPSVAPPIAAHMGAFEVAQWWLAFDFGPPVRLATLPEIVQTGVAYKDSAETSSRRWASAISPRFAAHITISIKCGMEISGEFLRIPPLAFV